MGYMLGFISCFSGSSKVMVDETEEAGSPTKAHVVDGNQEVKSKSRKTTAIPVTHLAQPCHVCRGKRLCF